MRLPTQPHRRTGATAVETAMVLIVFLMFLFGIYEYGRLLFTQQVMDTAARETARYAVSVINADTITDDHMKSYATERMFGLDKRLTGFQAKVEGIALKDGDTHKVGDAPFSWKEAGATDGVLVTLEGTFQTAVPRFILFGQTINLKSTSIMYSEGN